MRPHSAAVDDEIALVIPGPLQLAILAVLWRRDKARLTDILQAVRFDYKPVALSTVSTTMTRLIQRGWVKRTSLGLYRAGISRQQLIDQIVEHIERA